MPSLTIISRQIVASQSLGFDNCHAATVLEHKGKLLCAFFAGTREGASDTEIWLNSRLNGSWGIARPVTHDTELAHWNPVLFELQGHPALIYKAGSTVQCWHSRILTPISNTSHKVLIDNEFPHGPVKNKPLTGHDGMLSMPGSVEQGNRWDCFVERFDSQLTLLDTNWIPLTHRNGGGRNTSETWHGLNDQSLWETDIDIVFNWDGIIQPTLWESTPGQLHLLARSTRGVLYRSDSCDGGRHWCEAYATDISNNNSGIDLVRLDSGTLLLAHNPIASNWAKRTPLRVSASKDNGHHWFPLLDVEEADGEFSYPAIIAAGEHIHLAYTANRQEIRHVELTCHERQQ